MLEATSKGISAVLTPFGMAGTRPTTAEKKLDTQKHPNYDNYHVDEDGDVYLSGSEDLHDLKDVKAPDMTEEEAKKASSDATLVAVLHHLRKRFVEQGLVGEVQVGST